MPGLEANGQGKYTSDIQISVVILTIHFFSTLLAFISLAIVPIPFVFYKWGPAIRARTIKEPPKEELEDPTGMA